MGALPARNLSDRIDPSTGEDLGDWLSASEAALAMGLKPRRVRQLCRDGELTAVQLEGDNGPQWLIDPSSRPALGLAAGRDAALAVAGDPLAGLSQAKRLGAAERLRIVQAWERALAARPAEMTVTQYCDAWLDGHNAAGTFGRRLTRSTLYRWRKQLRERGVEGVIDRRTNHGPAACSPEAWQMFVGLYCRQQRPSVARMHEIVAAHAAAEEWAWPALRTVQQWAAERLDPTLRAAGRDPRAHRDRCLPSARRDWSQVPAMACWVGDHRQLDVLVPHQVEVTVRRNGRTHTETRWQWHRPWLTMWLDARSWMPAAWDLRFASPDGNQVMTTFARGVEQHGAPAHLYLDNGKDYRMYRFAGGRRRPARTGETIVAESIVRPMLELMGVGCTFALPYNAKAKIVEPWFKLLAERFDKTWPTYCGNNQATRPEQIKHIGRRKNAAAERYYRDGLTLEALRGALDTWIREDYARRPSPASAAEGLSPAEAFMRLRGDGFVPTRPSDEQLALLLMPSRPRTVRADGIYLRETGIWYWADELEPRRGASGRDRRRKVIVRYRPDRPGQIYVFDAESDRFICIATPRAGQRVHPLISTVADDSERTRHEEDLSALMALRRGRAKLDRKRIRAARDAADNRLLANARQAGAALGHGEDPDVPAAPAPVIRLGQAAAELHRAGRAAREAIQREQANANQPTAGELLATGTHDPSPPDAPAASSWDMMPTHQEPTDDTDR